MFFRVDREKAGLNGVSTEDIVQTLHIALGGMPAGVVHVPTEQNELPIVLRLPRESRSDAARLEHDRREGPHGPERPARRARALRGEDRRQDHLPQEPGAGRVRHRRNGRARAGLRRARPATRTSTSNPLPPGIRLDWRGEGEWKITLDVFRDLGIAFSAALLGIYVLLVYETASYVLPLVIMLSIPLTLIGIMPGFWLLNVLDEPAGRRLRQPGVLHRHGDDRHDRAGGHRGPQRHHPDRLHPEGRRARHAAGRGHRRVRRGPVPADLPDRGRGDARRVADHAGPDLQRAGLVADLRAVRLDRLHADRDPVGLRADLQETSPPRRVEP